MKRLKYALIFVLALSIHQVAFSESDVVTTISSAIDKHEPNVVVQQSDFSQEKLYKAIAQSHDKGIDVVSADTTSGGAVNIRLTYAPDDTTVYSSVAGTQVEQVLKSLSEVVLTRTNTNLDIKRLKARLLSQGIASEYRVSWLGGKLHHSLVVHLATGSYNLDLMNTLVDDSMMIKAGYTFSFDDLCLTSSTLQSNKVQKASITKPFKYYAQSDQKWKFIAFSNKNVWCNGCGVASTAMIYHYLTPSTVAVTPAETTAIAKAKKLDINETPRVDMPALLKELTAKYQVQHKVIKTFDKRNLRGSALKVKVADWKIKQQVKQEVASGKIVLISTLLNDKIRYTKGVEHFLVLIEYRNGEVLVADPLPNHTFYKKPTMDSAKEIEGYVYQVPIDILLENMTQAYSFDI